MHLSKLRVDRLADEWAGREDDPLSDQLLTDLTEAYENYLVALESLSERLEDLAERGEDEEDWETDFF